MTDPYSLDQYERPDLETPTEVGSVLLHSCCAPCSGEVLEAVVASGVKPTVLFYNPNIHPRDEYELRKEENVRFAEDLGVSFVDGDYETDQWFERVAGFEDEPEKGHRCTLCFDMRLERSALWAHENGFDLFASCLGISRWKDMDQINASGRRAAARYPKVKYWTFNWRRQGGAQRMLQLSKREGFYQQEYCGCVYSLRDMNRRRKAAGRPLIERGVHYYGVCQSCPETEKPGE